MPASPVSLAAVPTVADLYGNSRLKAPSSDSLGDDSKGESLAPLEALNTRLALYQGDITDLEVDAIVNAANSSLLGGGGVDGAIHARAGPELLRACEPLGGCETGSAKITPGFNLPAKHIIHAVGPIYARAKKEGQGREKELLQGCYRTALDLASNNDCRSIAFSAISTGVYGYPKDEAALIACQTVREWLLGCEAEAYGGLDKVIFCCYKAADLAPYERIIPQLFPPAESAPSKPDSAADPTTVTSPSKLPDMPSPPQAALSPSLPASKKAKLAPLSPQLAHEPEWETISHPISSARNGSDNLSPATSRPSLRSSPYRNSSRTDTTHETRRFHEDTSQTNGDPRRATSIHEDDWSYDHRELQTAALHMAQIGGDPPRSVLDMDW